MVRTAFARAHRSFQWSWHSHLWVQQQEHSEQHSLRVILLVAVTNIVVTEPPQTGSEARGCERSGDNQLTDPGQPPHTREGVSLCVRLHGTREVPVQLQLDRDYGDLGVFLVSVQAEPPEAPQHQFQGAAL